MSIAANQARTLLKLLAQLRPHWRRDPALPARIQSLLAGNRAFGSRDRRLYRELAYTTLRYLPWIEPLLDSDPAEAIRRLAWLATETPATRAFCAAHATGEPPTGDKAETLPAWFRPHCPEIFAGAELEAQLRRAPLWLRLQTDEPEAVLAEFDTRGWQWRRAEVLPTAVELLSEVDVTKTEAFARGAIEVQDLGSQMLLEAVGIEPGGQWLDACAGAGGKTLQLARLLGPTGHVDAHDVRADALAELQQRFRRARGDPDPAAGGDGWAGVRVIDRVGDPTYDGVLVDAPCSGSGTWRRAAHLKWITTESHIARSAELQRELLEKFSARVRPGGQLVYATCSLSREENEAIVSQFLEQHSEYEPAPYARTFGASQRGPGVLLLPALHDTDGFFVASLRRR